MPIEINNNCLAHSFNNRIPTPETIQQNIIMRLNIVENQNAVKLIVVFGIWENNTGA